MADEAKSTGQRQLLLRIAEDHARQVEPRRGVSCKPIPRRRTRATWGRGSARFDVPPSVPSLSAHPRLSRHLSDAIASESGRATRATPLHNRFTTVQKGGATVPVRPGSGSRGFPFCRVVRPFGKGKGSPFSKGNRKGTNRAHRRHKSTGMAAMAMRSGARLPRRSDRSERTTRVRAGRTEGGPRVAVVGVSGAVGQEFLRVLEKRNFPYSDMKMLASKRSAGKAYDFDGQSFLCEELNEESLRGVDIALFSAGGSVSKKFAPIASDLGCTVVDNSSAFRMTEGVPLVIPEVNPEAMAGMKYGQGGIIANPNCSTIICLVAVTPLHKKVPIKRMVVSTYQAASGAGQAAMDELEMQTKQALNNEPLTMDIFGRQYAFNLFSHNSDIGENGYNEEEMKLVKETGKIWSTNDVQVTATCIRVPVMRAHAESINLEFSSDITEEEAREVLAAAPGVSVYDNRAENDFPTPLMASNKDDVFVGRIRRDISRPDNRGLDIFICGDQIRKGAALNAVQVAELLL